ncbi:hypothetical protein HDE_09550 [Halotydeus destructor]|nr:hypothetical protein HDE_09550 [Halotydeus destructor]
MVASNDLALITVFFGILVTCQPSPGNWKNECGLTDPAKKYAIDAVSQTMYRLMIGVQDWRRDPDSYSDPTIFVNVAETTMRTWGIPKAALLYVGREKLKKTIDVTKADQITKEILQAQASFGEEFEKMSSNLKTQMRSYNRQASLTEAENEIVNSFVNYREAVVRNFTNFLETISRILSAHLD